MLLGTCNGLINVNQGHLCLSLWKGLRVGGGGRASLKKTCSVTEENMQQAVHYSQDRSSLQFPLWLSRLKT